MVSKLSKQMRKGFTMIEMIFVIVIMAILASIIIPKIMDSSSKNEISSVLQSDVRSIMSAVSEWRKTAPDAGSNYENLSTAKIAKYLPYNMKYDAAGDYIKSSGLNGDIHYTVSPDTVTNSPDTVTNANDSFKINMDASQAKTNNDWSDNLALYAETKFVDFVQKFAHNKGQISTNADEKLNTASDIKNDDTGVDAKVAVGQIRF